jgi:DNA-binding GntR family transcriptional regulator
MSGNILDDPTAPARPRGVNRAYPGPGRKKSGTSRGMIVAAQPQSLGDQAYDFIKGDIVLCKLAPGAEVTEAGLADRYQLGRAAIRSALSRLSQGGLVNVLPRRGYLIAPITVKGVQEIFELRLILEPAASRMATGHVDLARLGAANSWPTLSNSAKQNLRFLTSNRAFHIAIAQATGNDRLAQSIVTLHDEMVRLLNLGLFSSGRDPDAVRIDHELQRKQHEVLIASLAAGDPEAAERAAREHIEHSRDLVVQAIFRNRLSFGL